MHPLAKIETYMGTSKPKEVGGVCEGYGQNSLKMGIGILFEVIK